MNWCSIKHNWKYKKEDVSYERIGSLIPSKIIGHSSLKLNQPVTIPTEVRLCKRCNKKQMMTIRGYWIDWDLTPEEIRNIKLNKILN